MQDTWLTRYADCEQLGHEIMELINEKNRLARSGAVNAKVTSSIRVKLQQFSSEIKLMRDELMRPSASSMLLERELQRRQYQLDQLITKEKQLNEAFKREGRVMDDARSGLFNEGFEGPRTSKAAQRIDDMDDFSPGNIRQQQQQIIAEQDKGLDELYKVIQVQKRMGKDIGDEVDDQDELITDILDRTDNTKRRLIKETHHVKTVNKKSSTCALLVVIVLLLIAIVVVGVVPT